MGGRWVDDNPDGRWFGGAKVFDGAPSTTAEVGVISDETGVRVTDWSPAARAWAREPEPTTIEERLQALEERGD